jgi:hypothetical protein
MEEQPRSDETCDVTRDAFVERSEVRGWRNQRKHYHNRCQTIHTAATADLPGLLPSWARLTARRVSLVSRAVSSLVTWIRNSPRSHGGSNLRRWVGVSTVQVGTC